LVFDYTEAFDRMHQLLLIGELRYRYRGWALSKRLVEHESEGQQLQERTLRRWLRSKT